MDFRTQALARDLHEPESLEIGNMVCLALSFTISSPTASNSLRLIVGQLYIDKVDDDDAADIAQAKLAGNFFGRLHLFLVHFLPGWRLQRGYRCSRSITCMVTSVCSIMR